MVFVQTYDRDFQLFRNQIVAILPVTGHIAFRREWQSFRAVDVEIIYVESSEELLIVYSPFHESVEIELIQDQPPTGAWPIIRMNAILKKSVKQILRLDVNAIVILTEMQLVEIWVFDRTLSRFFKKYLLPVVNPQTVAVTQFQGHHYVAVTCATDRLTGLRNHVEVFMVLRHRVDHFQTIANVGAIQLKFIPVVDDQQLLLCILTRDPIRPLIVYRFAGMSKFVEMIGYSRLALGRHIEDFSVRISGTETLYFIIIVSKTNTIILQAI